MRHLLILTTALLGCAGPVLAQEAAPTLIMREGDDALTCIQISDEATQLSQTMGGETPNGSVFGRFGEVAKAGAAMVIPGVGLATAASDALTAPGRERREAEARAAEQRWYYLNGLYAGQRCQAATAAAAPAAVSQAPAPQIQPSSLQP
jgi:hypothetical protein